MYVKRCLCFVLICRTNDDDDVIHGNRYISSLDNTLDNICS
jgi:hypothetical protein